MQELIQLVLAELKGSWRFRWPAMAIAWLVCVGGWTYVYGIQNIYESQATVYVDTSSALRPLLQQMTVDVDVMSRVDLVTTAMLGRPQLEKVARDTDLHLRTRNDEEFESLLEGMRKRISINHNPRRDPSLYQLRYQDADPNSAQAVVTALLNNFVEDSLGANRLDTQKAQEFLREQLASIEADLTSSEQMLADFKKKNVGRMPGEGGDYFARLQSEMDLLEAARSDLRLAMRRKDALQQQLAGESPTTLDFVDGPQSELEQRIAENQSRLEELQLRFTDLHPDVMAVKNTLAQLQEQRQQQLNELRDSEGIGMASDNPVYQNIQIELTNANVEIAALEEQASAHSRKIDELRALIDVLPQVEAELSRLTRDYDVKRAQYQALLERLEVAELSESADQSDEVEFRVIDPPLLPDQPIAPNRPFLLFSVLVAGIFAGAGVAFLGNQLKPVFIDTASLREATGLPILGSVTAFQSVERQRKSIAQVTAFGGALAALCSAFVVVFLFHQPGSQFVRTLLYS